MEVARALWRRRCCLARALQPRGTRTPVARGRFGPAPTRFTSMAVVIGSLLDGGERHERLRALAPAAPGEHPLREEINGARDHRHDAGSLPVHSTPQEKPSKRPPWNTTKAAVYATAV